MLDVVEPEFAVAHVPAGEAAGGLLDVFLGVIAHTQAEQLHDLTGEVFVRVATAVGVAIQPDQHGWIAGDLVQ